MKRSWSQGMGILGATWAEAWDCMMFGNGMRVRDVWGVVEEKRQGWEGTLGCSGFKLIIATRPINTTYKCNSVLKNGKDSMPGRTEGQRDDGVPWLTLSSRPWQAGCGHTHLLGLSLPDGGRRKLLRSQLLSFVCPQRTDSSRNRGSHVISSFGLFFN